MVFEAFFRRKGGDTGEMFGDVLLGGGEYVDAQAAVLLQDGQYAGVSVDAEHHGGRLVGNRCDGGHGDAVAPGRAVGGDNVHTGRTGGHGVAKDLLWRGIHDEGVKWALLAILPDSYQIAK